MVSNRNYREKLASQILQIEDLKELAHRIQIAKRLLDIKVEKNIPLISSAKIWFYLFQYAMLLLQLFFILLWVSEFYRTTYWTLFVIGLFAACCNFNFYSQNLVLMKVMMEDLEYLLQCAFSILSQLIL